MIARSERARRGLHEHVGVKHTTLIRDDAHVGEVGLFNTGSRVIRRGSCIGDVRGQFRTVDPLRRSVRNSCKETRYCWQTSDARIYLPAGSTYNSHPLKAANEPPPGVEANAMLVLWSTTAEIGIPGPVRKIDAVRVTCLPCHLTH